MYSYQSPVNKGYIEQRYTDEDIFKHIFKQDIVLKKRMYHAPYRDDEHGTCFFMMYQGKLIFCDFANTVSHFTCYELYAKVYNIKKNLYQHIAEHVIPSNTKSLLKAQNNKKKKVKPKNNNNSGIFVAKQPFTKKDLDYWNKFGITKSQLLKDGVQSVQCIRIVNDDIDITFRINNLCFAYTEWENCIKIYQPLVRKDKKWLTNCKPNAIGGTNTIPNQDKVDSTLIITKSYKDWRVLINANCYSIWLQNEVTLPDRDLLLCYIERFSDIVILFDNDNTGIINAKKCLEFINLPQVRLIFTPYKNNKDSADLFFNKGKDKLVEFLQSNNINFKKNNNGT